MHPVFLQRSNDRPILQSFIPSQEIPELLSLGERRRPEPKNSLLLEWHYRAIVCIREGLVGRGHRAKHSRTKPLSVLSSPPTLLPVGTYSTKYCRQLIHVKIGEVSQGWQKKKATKTYETPLYAVYGEPEIHPE
jgi:hypothetical protein